MEATGDPAASLGRIDRQLTKKGAAKPPLSFYSRESQRVTCKQIALGGSDAHFTCSPASCIRRARLSRSVFSRCFRSFAASSAAIERVNSSMARSLSAGVRGFRGRSSLPSIAVSFPAAVTRLGAISHEAVGNGARRVGQKSRGGGCRPYRRPPYRPSQTLSDAPVQWCRTTLRNWYAAFAQYQRPRPNQPPPSKTRTRIMMRSVVVSMCVSQSTAKLSTLSSSCSSPRYRTPIAFNVLQHVLFHRGCRGVDEL